MNISKTKYSSQYIDNMSFDDGLKVKVTELVDSSGNLINPATEETLQAIAGLNYDTTKIDTTGTDIVIQYLKNSVVIFTETISKSGGIISITKS